MSSRKVSHPLFARAFDRNAYKLEELGQREHRQQLLAGLSRRVIEIGAGNGLNFPHYPETVSEVVAVEPEPYLRERAAEAAARAAVKIQVVDGTADALPGEDASFDAAIVSLVLCSVADQARALDELRRVLKPGGELRFYEHVRAENRTAARGQRIIDIVWPHIGGGCHTSRDTLGAITSAGFQIESCERFLFKPFPLTLPTAPHIQGVARR